MPSSPSSSPPRRSLVPEDGPDNPLFHDVDENDTLEATVLFRGPLTEVELDEAERAVLAWFSGAEWGGRLPILVDETLTTSCLHLAVTGVRTARHALGLLLDTLVAMEVPVARMVLVRNRADGDRDALVRGMDPAARPQVEYDDPEEWWRACFDPEVPPPLSEDRAELARDHDALLEVTQTTYAEHRGLPLHLAGIRICYGLREARFDEDGGVRERDQDIARALRAAVEERFCAGDAGEGRVGSPSSYNRRLQTGGPLDRVRAGERAGYSCAFRAADLREFLHDHLFRYREYELMLATRDAVRALDLEPVVCWRRIHGRYVVQLWERGASRLHQAA
jgi:hypothetical protein